MLIFFLTTSCQIDQSVNLIKEKLFSNEDGIENTNESGSEKNTNKSITKEPIEEKFDKKVEKLDLGNEINIKNTGNEKKVNDALKQNDSISDLSFKEMGKGRDTDSKIISFFTKIFDADDEVVESNQLEEDLNVVKLKKPKAKEQLGEDELKENLLKDEENFNEPLSSENRESFDIKDEDDEGEENDLVKNIKKTDKIEKSNSQDEIAFLQFKKPPIKKDKTIKDDNLVGLLLPLTGEKSSAGNLVINSLRYSMLLKPNQLNFKIFDTKSNPNGAIDAAKKGIDDDIRTFIGPIFSDETKTVRNYFKNNDNLTFFSLSPDLSNISNNVIVSGQNPEDQVSCIVQHLAKSETEKILLIYHADKYGYVIRNSVLKYVDSFGMSSKSTLDMLEVEDNINLNDEIKRLSKFESRKLKLNDEILNTKNDMTIEKNQKKKMIKSLERKLTLDSPFDSIIIASEGDKLLEILSHLAFYDINSENTRIYGTGLWEDSIKKDIVFEGTFFVTSLKKKDSEFIKSFRNVFSKDPISFNFHIHDLIELVQNYKVLHNEEVENRVFYGEFSNSKISSGLLKREIFLRKIKKNELTEDIFNCRLDVI